MRVLGRSLDHDVLGRDVDVDVLRIDTCQRGLDRERTVLLAQLNGRLPDGFPLGSEPIGPRISPERAASAKYLVRTLRNALLHLLELIDDRVLLNHRYACHESSWID